MHFLPKFEIRKNQKKIEKMWKYMLCSNVGLDRMNIVPGSWENYKTKRQKDIRRPLNLNTYLPTTY